MFLSAIHVMQPLPLAPMAPQRLQSMRDWAQTFGAAVHQRSVRQVVSFAAVFWARHATRFLSSYLCFRFLLRTDGITTLQWWYGLCVPVTAKAMSAGVLREGLNGVNRQPSKGQKSNRQPSNTENFNRQPSIKSVMINRQTSFIMDYYNSYLSILLIN